MVFSFPFLSLCSRIETEPDRLVARTPTFGRWLLLGASCRRAEIDRVARRVTLERRRFWFFRSARRLDFRHVAAVTYGYDDVYPGAFLLASHRSLDLFTVGVRLANGEEFILAKYFGEGTFSNEGPYPDWVYWDQELIQWSGTQEKASRLFAQLLSKMIGVRIEPPNRT